MSRFMYALVLLSSILLASMPVSARVSEELSVMNTPTVPGDEYWDDRFGCFFDMDALAETMVVFQDQLYVSGNDLDCHYDTSAYHTLIWNGRAWKNVYDVDFRIMVTSSDTLYGLDANFNGRIHAYDGQTWTILPALPLVDSWSSYAMTIFNDDVYIAVTGAVEAVFRWDGSEWSQIATTDTQILSLTASDHYLYIGGIFETVNGTAIQHIARWNGTSWFPVGDLESVAFDLVVVDNRLYCACSWPSGNNELALLQWQGSNWQFLTTFTGDPLDMTNGFIEAANGELYVHGGTLISNQQTFYGLARWNGTALEDVGLPFDSFSSISSRRCGICTLVWYDDSLIAGGNAWYIPDAAGSTRAMHPLWRFVDNQWRTLPGYSMHGTMSSHFPLVATSDGVYMTGLFFGVGNTESLGHAFWNGHDWHDWSANLPNDEYDFFNPLVISDTVFVVGGTQLDMYNRRYGNSILQRLPNGQWSELLTNSTVYGLAWWNNALYAIGSFGSIENGVSQVIRWDGTQWHAVGSIQLPTVGVELKAGSGELYALFNDDQTSTATISAWNGSSWNQVGSTINTNPVFLTTLEWHNNTIYAAGDAGLWRFNGSSWEQITAVVLDDVASGHDGLYVIGRFTSIGGISAQNIARWDGTTWHPLGSGLVFPSIFDSRASSIDVFGRNVYATGIFEQAGGHSSPHFAIWHNPTGPNTSPSTRSESFTLGQGQAVEIDLHTYAWDLDADELTFSNLTLSRGTLTDLGNGRVRIQAPFEGTEPLTLTYTVSDDHGDSTGGTLEWTITTRYLAYLPFMQ